MTQNQGKSVRVYLAEGSPQGILIAEIVNWTGHVLSAPRSKLVALLDRQEIEKAGVYLLAGPDPEGTGDALVYIGQSENVGKRLTRHNRNEHKAFWEKTFVITSKDQNLTSGHIKYLESKLISIARKSGLVSLTNDTTPDTCILPEADIADMEYFIVQLRLILPLLGLDFLSERAAFSNNAIVETTLPASKENRSPVFEIISKKYKLHAFGQQIDGEFIVQAGSQGRVEWVGKKGRGYSNLRSTLFEKGKLGSNNSKKHLVFKEDVVFSSPSAASAIIFGRASNGRTAWKIKGENKTYEDWQNSLLPKEFDIEE